MSINAARACKAPEPEDRIEIGAATPLSQALEAAAGAGALDIRFASFKDGRGFSLATMLRQRGYAGELRAVGDILPDQLDMLQRCGFDAVLPDAGTNARWTRQGFSHAYQPGAAGGPPAWRHRALGARKVKVEALNRQWRDAQPEAIIAAAVEAFDGRIAMLSSFGTEAAAGLALLARISPSTPVLFLDTRRHFAQTLSYKDRLVETLGLTRVITLEPDREEEARLDPDGRLHARDGQACCDLRKVEPLARGIAGYDALITGRKRYHGGQREALDPFEFDGERVKINPFANLTPKQFAELFSSLDLPLHPLAKQGYPSVGCWPCTAPAEGEGTREGRWSGKDRTECGIFDPARSERARRASVRLV